MSVVKHKDFGLGTVVKREVLSSGKFIKVEYGDRRRSTFVEASDRSEAIYKFHQDFGQDYVVRDCIELG